jgi:hypothetical protein
MEVKEKHSGNVAQHQVLEAKALKELSSKHHIISKKKKKKVSSAYAKTESLIAIHCDTALNHLC